MLMLSTNIKMTQQNTMDEALALATLRSIIAQALQECTPPSAEGTTNNSNNIETSSDPSNISSLSGVYSQAVQQQHQQQQSRQKYKEERERLLDIALEIERSVADLESVVHTSNDGNHNHHDRALNNNDGNTNNNNDVSTATTTIDMVESLVALLTTVPNALLTNLYNVEYASGQIILRNDNNTIVRQQQRHHNHGNQYVSSMEEICFNTACISCEILRMYIVQDIDGSFIDSLTGGGYTREFIDRLIHYLCSSSDDDLLLGRNIRYPIIQVMNTIVEQREMERTLLLEEERGYNNNIDNRDFFDYYDNHHHHGLVVFHMSAKDTLRLLQMLLRWIMGGRGGSRGITGSITSSSHGVDESQYSHVGVFTCHLLHHFANMTLTESGMYTTFHECRDLFRVWVEGGVQEHNHNNNNNMNIPIPRRLSNEDASVVLDLITNFQISSIQSAYHLVERADAMIVSLSCQDVDNGSTGTSNDIIRSENCAAAVHESIRHVGIVVSVTEVMEKLGLEIDPEMHVIFHPLIVSYATFVASGLQEALDSPYLSLGQEGVGLSHTADDLLVRICRTSLGLDFLKHSNDISRDEVLTVAVLRALSSGSISGKGKFLLEMVSNRAHDDVNSPNSNGRELLPMAKRPCYNNFMSTHLRARMMMDSNDNKQSRDMVDLMMLCMTMTQSNLDEGYDRSSIDQASCIASSLMHNDTDQKEAAAVIDPLNPWHSLNINTLKELTCSLLGDSDLEHDASIASTAAVIGKYSDAVPVCFDTRAATAKSV